MIQPSGNMYWMSMQVECLVPLRGTRKLVFATHLLAVMFLKYRPLLFYMVSH